MSLKLRMLAALPFSKNELALLIASAPIRYKEYSIPKRQPGKTRAIAQPTPEIKLIQRWIIANELKEFPVHKSATAYKKGVGLLENIAPHKNNRFLLKIDFNNFFPSITSSDFKEFMKGTNFNDEELFDLSQLLFKIHHPTKTLRLAIGAPSSPFLSNIMLHSLDTMISNKCEELEVTYTRYADDLSFSTNKTNVLNELEHLLPSLIANGTNIDLSINSEKTIHTSKKNGRQITGVTITEKNQVSIGRDKKRALRSQIFSYTNNLLSQDEIDKLRGYISFLYAVEPEQLERLKRKYGAEVMAKLRQQA